MERMAVFVRIIPWLLLNLTKIALNRNCEMLFAARKDEFSPRDFRFRP